jgi:hypothetical protein
MVALLAPVPEEHLRSGLDVDAREGKVAFGTRAWEAFYQLRELLNGQSTDAFLYASHPEKPLALPHRRMHRSPPVSATCSDSSASSPM